jgi:hypothetical protein
MSRLCAAREQFVKWQKRRNRTAESVDPEFAEALLGNSSERSSIDRKVLRKTQQFCRQVQRALNLALASGDSQFEGFEIFVEEVSPASTESTAASHRGRHEHLTEACTRADVRTSIHCRRRE